MTTPCFRVFSLLTSTAAFVALLVGLAGCGRQSSGSSADDAENSSAPGGLPPPGARSDLRQLRYEITYERDATLRARHREGSRDAGKSSFRVQVRYDELVELASSPEGSAWPTLIPTGTRGPVNGEIYYAGTYDFSEGAGTPTPSPAVLNLRGTFSGDSEVDVRFEHYHPYTDHYVAVVNFDAPVRGTLTGPMQGLGAVAAMMQAPFVVDGDDLDQLRLVTTFTVYPAKFLPRPSGLEGTVYDMQEKAIPAVITVGSLLGVGWRGAVVEGRPRGDWTYVLDGTHSSGASNETQTTDRVKLSIRTVPVTLAPHGSAGAQ